MKKKYNILVTGIGAIIGYGIINSIRKTGRLVNIIGMDIYSDAVGQGWCDQFIVAEPAKSDTYISFLRDIIEKNNIDIVFFGTEQEIAAVNAAREELKDIYDKFVINKKELFDVSEDKWLTFDFLRRNGFKTIDTYISGDYKELSAILGKQILLKPRKSYASKGIVSVDNEKEFNYYKELMGSQFMAQKIVGDKKHEYTAAAFGYGDGTCSTVICLKRELSQEGATAKAEVVFIPEIEEFILKTCDILKPIGPTNFQFRKSGEDYLLLEINPRISSSTSVRMAFGYNESDMCISYFVDKEKSQTIEIKRGHASRYIADYIWIDKE